MTIEELRVVISAETSGLKKQVNETKQQLEKLEKATDKSCKRMSNSFKKLFKGIGFTLIAKQLVSFSKQAVNTASDLEEVQNVVDVAFSSMSSDVEAFAQSAVKSFGMSELSAKRMASTFMAMSNGMGIAQDVGKTISLQLTALAGDMASFYNVEQEVAQTALNSVFTGETESLKKFGVVLTEANLSAFALANGITKSYSAMSQAEKILLRYNYVLNATKNAQGDFARTSGSWANQVRILKEQWQQLLGILGNLLIKVLLPIVKVLNQILTTLITIGNFFVKLFNINKIRESLNSINSASNSSGNLASNMNDAASGLEDSNKEAKKLSKTLAGFDELNILNDNSTDTTDIDTGSFDTSGLTDIDLNGLENISGALDYSALEKFKIQLHDLVNALYPFMRIWDEFVKGFNLDRINQTIDKTVSNAQVKFTEFGKTLDFSKYQPTIEKFAYSLGELLGTIVNNTADALGTVITDLFDSFSPAITEFINNTIPRWIDILSEVLKTLTTVADQVKIIFDAVWATISPFFDLLGEILTDIQQKFQVFWENYGQVIFDKLRTTIEEIGDTVLNIWNTIFDPIFSKAIELLGGLWREHLSPLMDTLLKVIGQLGITILDIINNFLLPFINFIVDTFGPVIVDIINTLLPIITTAIGDIADIINDFLTLLLGVLEVLSGVFTNDWTKIWQGMQDIFKGFWNGLGDLVKAPLNVVLGIINAFLSAITEGINMAIRAINKIDINIPDWIPVIGGKSIKFNIDELEAPQIPTLKDSPLKLANGGVLTSPTLAMMGEYAGASNNPEIVTPQSLMKETMEDANSSVINAIFAIGNQIAKSVDDKNMDIYMDTAKVTRRITKEQTAQKKQMGTSLVMV